MVAKRGDNMNIKFSEELYSRLIQLCKNNKFEVSGYILGALEDEDFRVTDLELHSESLIAKSTKTNIDYNANYIQDKIFRLKALQQGGILIEFHTHPTLMASSELSAIDINYLRSTQALADKICTSGNLIVCEGVVNRQEVCFYAYDAIRDETVRIPMYVNGVEIAPFRRQSLLESFKKGFIIVEQKINYK